MASWRMVALGCVIVGCGPVVDGGGDGDGDSTGGEDTRGDTMTSATTASTTATTTATTTASTSFSTTDTTVSTSADPSVSATDPSASASTFDPSETDSDTDSGGELPNGSMCVDDFECASGHCYVVGILGGLCGECNGDIDCPDGGCTLPNPLAQPPQGAVCNSGSYGQGCESDAVCSDGLVCATTVEVPGVIVVSTCSECQVDADCEMGSTCEPDIALGSLTGVKRCVIGGTLANGQSCDFASGGDVACASGHCAVADIMGLLQIGVCSSCETDGECVMPQVCEPPQADLNAGVFIPGACG